MYYDITCDSPPKYVLHLHVSPHLRCAGDDLLRFYTYLWYTSPLYPESKVEAF